MEKRIELEKRARKENQITELNLDNCRSTSIVGLTDEYTALETLSLINVGLTTLKGFPKLPNLKKLELSDNRISNGLNYLTTSPKLQYLNLSGNKIKDLEALEPLQEFKNLTILDLFNNEATQIDNYREKIFEMLPSLKFLDGFDCNDVEAPSDGDDDEEVNGNDSEDEDKETSFCLNGLEIDLVELAELERRVEAKKKLQQSKSDEASPPSELAVVGDAKEDDDLDLYLSQLRLKEAKDSATNDCDSSKLMNSNVADSAVMPVHDGPHQMLNSQQRPPINFAILLYWFLAIINLAQVACYSGDAMGEEEDEDEQVDDENCSLDDEDECSSSYDEISDYEENDDEDGDEDDVEDVDSEDENADCEVKKSSSGAKSGAKVKENAENNVDAAESQARGKKRKHDG